MHLIKSILCFCSFIILTTSTAQKSTYNSALRTTFKIKISDIENPDSVALMWYIQPFEENITVDHVSLFPSQPSKNGLYELTINFPDSLQGKSIGYRYLAAQNKSDIWRSFVLEEKQLQEKIDSWGFLDGLEGMVRPGKILFPSPNSAQETTIFEKSFVGITTDGKPIKNLFPIQKTGVSTLTIKNALTLFLGSLTEEQKVISVFPIESNEWRRWHNIESWERAGVCLEKMNSLQKIYIFDLLKESLSARGLQKVKDIMTMEAYLATLVPDIEQLGSEKYWFTFYGTPSDTEPYGWQIEGHHLVINYFVLGDQIVMTPTFMGSEPNYIESGEHEGLRTFETEEKKGLNLYLSLTKLQKQKATLFHQKEFDFNRSEAFRDNEIIPRTGISAKLLTKKQKAALIDLISEYINNISVGHAKIKMRAVLQHLNETNFTWIQGNKTDGPFYYRIHSPVILIEFDHQTPVFIFDQSNPNSVPVKSHIHTVVRTPNGNDYGKDLLKAHLEKDHKH